MELYKKIKIETPFVLNKFPFYYQAKEKLKEKS